MTVEVLTPEVGRYILYRQKPAWDFPQAVAAWWLGLARLADLGGQTGRAEDYRDRAEEVYERLDYSDCAES